MVKNPPVVQRPGFNPGLGRSPEGGHGNPLQYFCLENPHEQGAWQATVMGSQRDRTELLSTHKSSLTL